MFSAKVIDADGHVSESQEKVAKYLDDPFRRRSFHLSVYPWDGWDRRLFGSITQWAGDAKTWLSALDDNKVECAVLYPTLGLFLAFSKDEEWNRALSKAYNRFLREEFMKVSPRLKGAALLPMENPDEAAEDLQYAATELGHIAGILLADCGYLLGHQRFFPIYKKAEELGIPLAVHSSGSSLSPGAGGFTKFIQTHTVAHIFGQMRQLSSIVLGGIPELFPSLKFIFLESGVGWVPHWMWKMDEEFEKRGQVEALNLKKKPSDYVRSGSIYFSCEASEPLLPVALQAIGENQLVYASDFPHWDNDFPESLDKLRNRKDLTEIQKQKIFAENAKRLYRLQDFS